MLGFRCSGWIWNLKITSNEVQGYGQGSSTIMGIRGFQAPAEFLGVPGGPTVDWEFSAWGGVPDLKPAQSLA